MRTAKSKLPATVSAEQWRAELEDFLQQEKQLTAAQDALNAARRRLPMMRVEKQYSLTGENGEASLLDMFEGRSQLIVYHFMFAPEWKAGCEGCSWVVDAMTHPAHLHARDTTLVIVARAAYEKLLAYRKRMGWTTPIPWYSSLNSEFNFDFDATSEHGEEHGASVFLRDGSDIYRCYYTGARGVEYLGTQWSWLDLTVWGRQEQWEDSPEGWPQTPTYEWCRRHDEYTDK